MGRYSTFYSTKIKAQHKDNQPNTINPQDWNNWNPQNPVIPIFTYIHLPSLPVTGGRNPYECTIEGMREVEHQSERDYERKIV